jgi:hypothetical protein
MVGTHAPGVHRILRKAYVQCGGVLVAALFSSCALLPTPSTSFSDASSGDVLQTRPLS